MDEKPISAFNIKMVWVTGFLIVFWGILSSDTVIKAGGIVALILICIVGYNASMIAREWPLLRKIIEKDDK